MTYFFAMLIAAIIVILIEWGKTFTCTKCEKDNLLKCDVKWNKKTKGYLCFDCMDMEKLKQTYNKK